MFFYSRSQAREQKLRRYINELNYHVNTFLLSLSQYFSGIGGPAVVNYSGCLRLAFQHPLCTGS